MPNASLYWSVVTLYLVLLALWMAWVPPPRNRCQRWIYWSFLSLQLLLACASLLSSA